MIKPFAFALAKPIVLAKRTYLHSLDQPGHALIVAYIFPVNRLVYFASGYVEICD